MSISNFVEYKYTKKMPKVKRIEFPDFASLGKGMVDLHQSLPDIAGISATNFFQDRFTQGGWIDRAGFEKWDDRKDPNANGSTLLVSGFLKAAFDYSRGKDWVNVRNYAPYSEIHNDGGVMTIPVTARSRKYFWFMYYKTNDLRWKFMAITKKKSFQFYIPTRQFMGDSKFFMQRLERNYFKQVEKLENKL